MGIIGLLALERGHTQTVRLSILWTACFMLLWRPQLMWYDVGFQMSFLAVIGLSELSPTLTKIFAWIPETAGMRLAMVGTIAAQITTLPLTVFLFGQISLIAPIANILVAPLVPIAMLLGTIATLLSTVSPTLGLTVALLARLPLEGIINIALICGNLPFAAINI
jgi:competence protein ComEC